MPAAVLLIDQSFSYAFRSGHQALRTRFANWHADGLLIQSQHKAKRCRQDIYRTMTFDGNISGRILSAYSGMNDIELSIRSGAP